MTEAVSASRVAFLLRDFHGGGAERNIITIANGLARAGMAIDLVVFRGDGPFRDGLAEEIRCIELRTPRSGLAIILALPKLVAYLARVRPRKVVTTLEGVSIVARLAATLVGRGRDVVIRLAVTYDCEPRRWVRRLLVELVYRLHNGDFVANSQQSADHFLRAFPRQRRRLHVVYNAVDLHLISAQRRREKAVVDGLSMGKRRFILFVGRLTHQKRPDVLLHAFHEVSRHVDVDLIVLGEGPLREKLSELVESLELQHRVFMPGFVANPYSFMEEAAALALSSDYEGMPTVLIEALACGCQIAATDCPSGPREVLGDGAFGQLARVGDAQSLADAILRALECPMPAAKLRRRAEEFSQRVAVDSYRKLLAVKGGGGQMKLKQLLGV